MSVGRRLHEALQHSVRSTDRIGFESVALRRVRLAGGPIDPIDWGGAHRRSAISLNFVIKKIRTLGGGLCRRSRFLEAVYSTPRFVLRALRHSNLVGHS